MNDETRPQITDDEKINIVKQLASAHQAIGVGEGDDLHYTWLDKELASETTTGEPASVLKRLGWDEFQESWSSVVGPEALIPDVEVREEGGKEKAYVKEETVEELVKYLNWHRDAAEIIAGRKSIHDIPEEEWAPVLRAIYKFHVATKGKYLEDELSAVDKSGFLRGTRKVGTEMAFAPYILLREVAPFGLLEEERKRHWREQEYKKALISAYEDIHNVRPSEGISLWKELGYELREWGGEAAATIGTILATAGVGAGIRLGARGLAYAAQMARAPAAAAGAAQRAAYAARAAAIAGRVGRLAEMAAIAGLETANALEEMRPLRQEIQKSGKFDFTPFVAMMCGAINGVIEFKLSDLSDTLIATATGRARRVSKEAITKWETETARYLKRSVTESVARRLSGDVGRRMMAEAAAHLESPGGVTRRALRYLYDSVGQSIQEGVEEALQGVTTSTGHASMKALYGEDLDRVLEEYKDDIRRNAKEAACAFAGTMALLGAAGAIGQTKRSVGLWMGHDPRTRAADLVYLTQQMVQHKAAGNRGHAMACAVEIAHMLGMEYMPRSAETIYEVLPDFLLQEVLGSPRLQLPEPSKEVRDEYRLPVAAPTYKAVDVSSAAITPEVARELQSIQRPQKVEQGWIAISDIGEDLMPNAVYAAMRLLSAINGPGYGARWKPTIADAVKFLKEQKQLPKDVVYAAVTAPHGAELHWYAVNQDVYSEAARKAGVALQPTLVPVGKPAAPTSAVPTVSEAPTATPKAPVTPEVVPTAPEAAPTAPEAPEAAPTAPEAPEAAPTTPEATEAAPTTPEATEAAPTTPEATEAAPTTPEALEAAPTAPEAVPSASEVAPTTPVVREVERTPRAPLEAPPAGSEAAPVATEAVTAAPTAPEAVSLPPGREVKRPIVPPGEALPYAIDDVIGKDDGSAILEKARASIASATFPALSTLLALHSIVSYVSKTGIGRLGAIAENGIELATEAKSLGEVIARRMARDLRVEYSEEFQNVARVASLVGLLWSAFGEQGPYTLLLAIQDGDTERAKEITAKVTNAARRTNMTGAVVSQIWLYGIANTTDANRKEARRVAATVIEEYKRHIDEADAIPELRRLADNETQFGRAYILGAIGLGVREDDWIYAFARSVIGPQSAVEEARKAIEDVHHYFKSPRKPHGGFRSFAQRMKTHSINLLLLSYGLSRSQRQVAVKQAIDKITAAYERWYDSARPRLHDALVRMEISDEVITSEAERLQAQIASELSGQVTTPQTAAATANLLRMAVADTMYTLTPELTTPDVVRIASNVVATLKPSIKELIEKAGQKQTQQKRGRRGTRHAALEMAQDVLYGAEDPDAVEEAAEVSDAILPQQYASVSDNPVATIALAFTHFLLDATVGGLRIANENDAASAFALRLVATGTSKDFAAVKDYYTAIATSVVSELYEGESPKEARLLMAMSPDKIQERLNAIKIEQLPVDDTTRGLLSQRFGVQPENHASIDSAKDGLRRIVNDLLADDALERDSDTLRACLAYTGPRDYSGDDALGELLSNYLSKFPREAQQHVANLIRDRKAPQRLSLSVAHAVWKLIFGVLRGEDMTPLRPLVVSVPFAGAGRLIWTIPTHTNSVKVNAAELDPVSRAVGNTLCHVGGLGSDVIKQASWSAALDENADVILLDLPSSVENPLDVIEASLKRLNYGGVAVVLVDSSLSDSIENSYDRAAVLEETGTVLLAAVRLPGEVYAGAGNDIGAAADLLVITKPVPGKAVKPLSWREVTQSGQRIINASIGDNVAGEHVGAAGLYNVMRRRGQDVSQTLVRMVDEAIGAARHKVFISDGINQKMMPETPTQAYAVKIVLLNDEPYYTRAGRYVLVPARLRAEARVMAKVSQAYEDLLQKLQSGADYVTVEAARNELRKLYEDYKRRAVETSPDLAAYDVRYHIVRNLETNPIFEAGYNPYAIPVAKADAGAAAFAYELLHTFGRVNARMLAEKIQSSTDGEQQTLPSVDEVFSYVQRDEDWIVDPYSIPLSTNPDDVLNSVAFVRRQDMPVCALRTAQRTIEHRIEWSLDAYGEGFQSTAQYNVYVRTRDAIRAMGEGSSDVQQWNPSLVRPTQAWIGADAVKEFISRWIWTHVPSGGTVSLDDVRRNVTVTWDSLANRYNISVNQQFRVKNRRVLDYPLLVIEQDQEVVVPVGDYRLGDPTTVVRVAPNRPFVITLEVMLKAFMNGSFYVSPNLEELTFRPEGVDVDQYLGDYLRIMYKSLEQEFQSFFVRTTTRDGIVVQEPGEIADNKELFERVKQRYKQHVRSYVRSEDAGDIPAAAKIGMNPRISLRSIQRKAVNWLAKRKNGLVGIFAGAGKTYIYATAAMLKMRDAFGRRVGSTLWVTSPSAIESVAADLRKLYPNEVVMTITTHGGGMKIDEFLRAARDSNAAFILIRPSDLQYMAVPVNARNSTLQHLMFGHTTLLVPDHARADEWAHHVSEITDMYEEIKKETDDAVESGLSKSATGQRAYDVAALLGNVKALVLDEIHLLANFDMKCKDVANSGHVTRAKRAVVLTDYLRRRGASIIGGSATLVRNTIGDLMTALRLTAPPDVVLPVPLTTSASQFAIFGQVPGVRADMRGKVVANVPIVLSGQSMLSMFGDIVWGMNDSDAMEEMLHETGEGVPKIKGGEWTQEMVEVPSLQRIVDNGMIRRLYELSRRSPNRNISSAFPLVLVNFFRSVSVAPEAYGVEDKSGGKLTAMAERVVSIANEKSDTPVCQLVLLERYRVDPSSGTIADTLTNYKRTLMPRSTDPTEWYKHIEPPGDDVMELAKKTIVRKSNGTIKEDEVLIIRGDDTSDPESYTELSPDLISRINDGKYKVILASSVKVREGANIQKYLKAVHVLTLPWTVADLVQQVMRAVRVGNVNKEVGVHLYIARGTPDVAVAAVLLRKVGLNGMFSGYDVDAGFNEETSAREILRMFLSGIATEESVQIANLTNQQRELSQRIQTYARFIQDANARLATHAKNVEALNARKNRLDTAQVLLAQEVAPEDYVVFNTIEARMELKPALDVAREINELVANAKAAQERDKENPVYPKGNEIAQANDIAVGLAKKEYEVSVSYGDTVLYAAVGIRAVQSGKGKKKTYEAVPALYISVQDSGRVDGEPLVETVAELPAELKPSTLWKAILESARGAVDRAQEETQSALQVENTLIESITKSINDKDAADRHARNLRELEEVRQKLAELKREHGIPNTFPSNAASIPTISKAGGTWVPQVCVTEEARQYEEKLVADMRKPRGEMSMSWPSLYAMIGQYIKKRALVQPRFLWGAKRVVKRGYGGFVPFDSVLAVIRWFNPVIAIHEIGHIIHNVYGMPSDTTPFENFYERCKRASVGSVASSGAPEEGVADCIRMWVCNREALDALGITDYVEEYLKSIGVLDFMNDVTRLVHLMYNRSEFDHLAALARDKSLRGPVLRRIADFLWVMYAAATGRSRALWRYSMRAASLLEQIGTEDAEKMASILYGDKPGVLNFASLYNNALRSPEYVLTALQSALVVPSPLRYSKTAMDRVIKEYKERYGIDIPRPPRAGEPWELYNHGFLDVLQDIHKAAGAHAVHDFLYYWQLKELLLTLKEEGANISPLTSPQRIHQLEEDIKRLEEQYGVLFQIAGKRMKMMFDIMLIPTYISGRMSYKDLVNCLDKEWYAPLFREPIDEIRTMLSGSGEGRMLPNPIPYREMSSAPVMPAYDAIVLKLHNVMDFYLENQLRTLVFVLSTSQIGGISPIATDVVVIRQRKDTAPSRNPEHDRGISDDPDLSDESDVVDNFSHGLLSDYSHTLEAIGAHDPRQSENEAVYSGQSDRRLEVYVPRIGRVELIVLDPLLYLGLARRQQRGIWPAIATIARVAGDIFSGSLYLFVTNPVFAFVNAFYRDMMTAMYLGKRKIPFYYLYTGLREIVRQKRGKVAHTFDLADLGQLVHLRSVGRPVSLGQVLAEAEIADIKSPAKWAWRRLCRDVYDWVVGTKATAFFDDDPFGPPSFLSKLPGRVARAMLTPFYLFNRVTGLEYLSELLEAAPRVGAYVEAKREGATESEAILRAMALTGYFAERPASYGIELFMRSVAFMRPIVSYLSQVWVENLLFARKKDFARQVAQRTLPLIGLGATTALIHVAIGGGASPDEERRRKFWRTERERSDLSKRLYATVGVFRLPVPDGPVGALFAFGYNSTMKVAQDALEDSPSPLHQKWNEVVRRTVGRLPPDLLPVPNVLAMPLQLYANYHLFLGREISPEELRNIPPHLLGPSDVAAGYLDVAHGAGIDPFHARFLVRNYAGIYGDDLVVSLGRLVNKDPILGHELADVPLIGRLFAREPRGTSSASVQTLIEIAKEATTLKSNIQRMVRTIATDKTIPESYKQALIEEAEGLYDKIGRASVMAGGWAYIEDMLARRNAEPMMSVEARMQVDRHITDMAYDVLRYFDSASGTPVAKEAEEKIVSRIADAVLTWCFNRNMPRVTINGQALSPQAAYNVIKRISEGETINGLDKQPVELLKEYNDWVVSKKIGERIANHIRGTELHHKVARHIYANHNVSYYIKRGPARTYDAMHERDIPPEMAAGVAYIVEGLRLTSPFRSKSLVYESGTTGK